MAYAQSERSVLTKATHWPTVVIDNVAEYYGQSTREEWDYGRDFPNLAPPFHAAFFEYKYPRTWIAADDDGVLRDVGDSLHATHSGSLVVGWPYEAFAEKVYYEHSLGVNRVEPAMYSSVCELQGHAQWVLQFSWWAAVRGHSSPLNTCAAVWFFVDAHGAYIRHLNKPGVLALILGQKHDVAAELHPVLLALSFMHCKNVARRDATDTEGPSDKWLRRTRQPKLRYHVLDIEPMKQVLRTKGGIEHNGLKKALHICRGHFATYTNDAPLFGKHTGTFWKPQHVRGDTKLGEVVKDYRVKL
jgi:hypothetical protein